MPGYQRLTFVCAFLLLVIVGFSATARNGDMQKLPAGTWGGPHIRIIVDGKSATVEYDCAHGTIEGPFSIDGAGKFNFTGKHVRERGGPVRQGKAQDSYPAQYTGWTDGKKMTLAVTLIKTNEELGTFELTHGEEGRLWKCK